MIALSLHRRSLPPLHISAHLVCGEICPGAHTIPRHSVTTLTNTSPSAPHSSSFPLSFDSSMSLLHGLSRPLASTPCLRSLLGRCAIHPLLLSDSFHPRWFTTRSWHTVLSNHRPLPPFVGSTSPRAPHCPAAFSTTSPTPHSPITSLPPPSSSYNSPPPLPSAPVTSPSSLSSPSSPFESPTAVRAAARAAREAEEGRVLKKACGEAPEEEGPEMVDTRNPETGEVGGPRGKEPTRYGDWEAKGRCWDF